MLNLFKLNLLINNVNIKYKISFIKIIFYININIKNFYKYRNTKYIYL